jgi:hypothetical protein
MHKSVKEEYGGEGGLREVILRGEIGGLILGALGFAERSGVLEWDCISTGTGVAGGFGHGGQDIHMISWS